MESDHNEEDCALAKGKVGPLILKTSSSQRSGVEGASHLPKGKSRMVCFSWNQGECSFPYTVGTGTSASSVEVNTVLFTAMLGVQIGRAGASRVMNPKAGTLKGVIHRAGSWHTRVDVAGWQSRTGSHAYDFHHI